jgi:hypothetical protein
MKVPDVGTAAPPLAYPALESVAALQRSLAYPCERESVG